MSLQIAAQHLASKGRNGDSMLVHMTPDEVKGLQALAMAHGGSLSVNPDTGLVEANFLKSLLPTLLGVGLSFIPGMQPWAAGLLVGGGTALATGDLGKGIMAGLGAFGGAGLGSSLAATGAEAAGTTAMQTEAAKQAATMQAAADAGTAMPAWNMGNIEAAKAAATQEFANQGALSQLGSGINASIQNPNMFMSNLGTTFPTTTEKMLAATPTISELAKPPAALQVATADTTSNYAGPYKPQERTVQYPTNRDSRDSSEFTFFTPMNPYPGFQTAAEGGLMGLARGQYFDDEPGSDEGFAPGGLSMKDGSFVMSAREVAEVGNGSSSAGLERLSKMGAQPIRGKGDGVSDSIKANIGGEQEARVARDEAYFPPEAVKKIGGGSPKKGAKKLYALMSAAEKARKKAPRGEDSGLHRLMPA